MLFVGEKNEMATLDCSGEVHSGTLQYPLLPNKRGVFYLGGNKVLKEKPDYCGTFAMTKFDVSITVLGNGMWIRKEPRLR